MSKSLPGLPKEETITIPRASFDAMFRQMEEMQEEIDQLKQQINGTTTDGGNCGQAD